MKSMVSGQLLLMGMVMGHNLIKLVLCDQLVQLDISGKAGMTSKTCWMDQMVKPVKPSKDHTIACWSNYHQELNQHKLVSAGKAWGKTNPQHSLNPQSQDVLERPFFFIYLSVPVSLLVMCATNQQDSIICNSAQIRLTSM